MLRKGVCHSALSSSMLAHAGLALKPLEFAMEGRLKRLRWLDAISWQVQLSLLGIQPCCRSRSRVMKLGAGWLRALALLTRQDDVVAFSAAASVCEKWEQWHWAAELLNSMDVRPNCISFNTLLSAYRAQWQAAISLLSAMRGALVVSDTVSFNAAINASPWKRAFLHLARMQVLLLRHSTISFNAALQDASWLRCLELLEWMSRATVRRSMVSDSGLLRTLERASLWPVAVASLKGMRPDIVTIGAAINTVGKTDAWHVALHMVKSLNSLAMTNNLVTCTSGLCACAVGRRWLHAASLFFRVASANELSCSNFLAASPWWRRSLSSLWWMWTQGLRAPLDVVSQSCASGHQWRRSLDLGDLQAPSWNLLAVACEETSEPRLGVLVFISLQQAVQAFLGRKS